MDKKLQNLNNDQNVTNSDQKSKSYKNWTMTKMLKILIIGQKVTKSEQNQMLQILIKGKKVTKSEQWQKCCKFWSKVKKLQNLNKNQKVASSDEG